MRYIYSFLIIFISGSVLWAQSSSFDRWLKPKEGRKIEPFVMMQLWGNYTFNEEVYDGDIGGYLPVEDRWNVLLRRARLGFQAEPYPTLKFQMVGAYDLIGRDLLSGVEGGTNNGSLPNFGIWDAFFQWQVEPGNDAFHVVAGYFRPQFSRESITSGWSVNSMEKAMSQNYIRKHLVGTGPGRAVGINLGGLLRKEDSDFAVNYNVGIFNPVTLALGGNSVGSDFAPLVVARSVLNFGDPEMTSYKIGYDINYFNERKGLSLGLAGAWQGQTEIFTASYAAEADVLFNWGALNVDGEWVLMWREGGANGKTFTHRDQTGHIRLGYNLILAERYFVEPSFMVMAYQGAMDATGQAEAMQVGASAGEEHTYDLGINWYLDKKRLKLLLHYTWRQGDPGAAGDGSNINTFFNQGGVGPIHRGNWLGMGLHAIF